MVLKEVSGYKELACRALPGLVASKVVAMCRMHHKVDGTEDEGSGASSIQSRLRQLPLPACIALTPLDVGLCDLSTAVTFRRTSSTVRTREW